MTIAELIDMLSTLPKDARVVTCGYEGGFTDITGATPKNLVLNLNKEWYYGPHDDPPDNNTDPVVLCFVL